MLLKVHQLRQTLSLSLMNISGICVNNIILLLYAREAQKSDKISMNDIVFAWAVITLHLDKLLLNSYSYNLQSLKDNRHGPQIVNGTVNIILFAFEADYHLRHWIA